MINGAQSYLQQKGYQDAKVYWVSGAFEIPLLSQKLLKTNDALIALGVVIEGKTAHFDYVCQGLTDGIMRVILDSEKPIGFGVLMTYSREDAEKRAKDKEKNKGWTTAAAVIKSLEHCN
eukprot:COSAG01_NODE_14_length_41020_cov_40.702133_44_plen_119_part_00